MDQESVAARVYLLFREEIQGVALGSAVFQSVPESHRSPKINAIRWYFQEDHFPKLEEREVVFIRHHTTPEEKLTERIKAAGFACKKSIDRLALQINTEVADGLDALTCPITHELFEDPVVDNHGHTFERKALEDHFEKSEGKLCPLSREEISSLQPNRSIKDQVDQMKAVCPIPVLPSMEGKQAQLDPEMAEQMVAMAKTLADKQKHQAAIDILKNAFTHSDNAKDFSLLPQLYVQGGQTKKGTLAYLYLAKRYLEENRLMAAEAVLAEACDLLPEDEGVAAAYAEALFMNGKKQEASKVFRTLAMRPNLKEPPLNYWQEALETHPDNPELYQDILPFCQSLNGQIHLLVMGMLQLHKTHPGMSETLYKKAAALEPQNIAVHLARLRCLPKEHLEVIPLSRKLASLYQEGDTASSLYYFRKAAKTCDPHDLRSYISLLQKTGDLSSIEQVYLKWIERAYPNTRSVIQEAMQILGRTPVLLEHLLKIEEEGKSYELLLELGVMYETGNHFSQAERIFRIAQDRFDDFESSFKLAGVIARRNISEAVRSFSDLSQAMMKRQDLAKVSRCIAEIDQLDPALAFLSPKQRKAFLSQSLFVSLFKENLALRGELKADQDRGDQQEMQPHNREPVERKEAKEAHYVNSDQKKILQEIDSNPKNAIAYTQLAETIGRDEKILLLNGREMTKEKLLLQAIAIDPQNVLSYRELARTLFEKTIRLLDGTEMTKQQLYLKAIDLDPRDATSYRALASRLSIEGTVHLLDGTEMTKQQLFLKAIDLDPSDDFTYLNLANDLPPGGTVRFLDGTEMTKEQLSKIITLKAIDRNPTKAWAYRDLADNLPPGGTMRLLDGTEMTEQQLYLKAIDLKPKDAWSFNNLAYNLPPDSTVCLLNGTEMTKQQLYLKSIDLKPTKSKPYRNIADDLPPGNTVRLFDGTEMTKQQLYLKAIDLAPKDACVYSILADNLPPRGTVRLLDGTVMTQQQLYLKEIDLDPSNAMVYYNFANRLPSEGSVRLLDGTEMTKQQLYLKAIDLAPKQSWYYNNLAHELPSGESVRLLDGSEMTKQQLYLKAIDLDPNNAYAYCNLASIVPTGGTVRLLDDTEMTNQQLYLKAIDLDSTEASAYRGLAHIVPKGGFVCMPDGVEMTKQQLCLKAIALDPKNAWPYHSIANALLPGGTVRLLNGTVMTKEQLLKWGK